MRAAVSRRLMQNDRLQHDTRIFNVGNRRRVAAGAIDSFPAAETHDRTGVYTKGAGITASFDLLDENRDGLRIPSRPGHNRNPPSFFGGTDIEGGIDQSAAFFDPNNKAAAQLREKVALETLDELLHFILYEGGSVGILDATNSNLERRKAVLDRIRQVAGKQIGVVFLESECHDEKLLEANMRLKLQGPDYKDSDPVQALVDFKKRGVFWRSSGLFEADVAQSSCTKRTMFLSESMRRSKACSTSR